MERFANRDVCDITIVDYVTGKPVMYIDYANANSTELTGEAVYAYGGHNHVRRVTFQGERAGTLTLETQIQTFELYQLATGGVLKTEANFIQREKLTSVGKKLTLTATPIDGSVNVYKLAEDCEKDKDLQGVTVSNTTVSLPADAEDGEYVVYYVKALDDVKALSISTKDFPTDVRIYGETFMKTETSDIVAYKMIAWKAAAQPNANWGFSNTGDPATLTITFDLMPDTKNDDRILDLIMEK